MAVGAARKDDVVGHAGGGKVLEGSANAKIQGKPAARAHVDHAKCEKEHPPKLIAKGSATVTVNGKPLARLHDEVECGATVRSGATTVFVGG